MELFQAHNQWANRPDDERFASLQSLRDACHAYYTQSATATANSRDLSVQAEGGGELILHGANGGTARFSHHGFGQMCQRVGAPVAYIRGLIPVLAALNLTYGFAASEKTQLKLLLHTNGGWLVRAATSEIYERIWNWQVADWALDLPSGWRVPPARPAGDSQRGARPATQDDILDDSGFGLSVNVGDMIAPAGLYASDHDMFIFLVNEGRTLEVDKEVLSRGFFARNNEVGTGSLVFTMFLYEHVCGNHIVWGAQKVEEVRIRHVGDFCRTKASEAVRQIRQFADSSASQDEKLIREAKRKELGATQGEVIDLVFDRGIFSRRRAEEVYAVAQRFSDTHGNPRSAWGYAAGATRLSQTLPYADERDQMDRAARKVLELAF